MKLPKETRVMWGRGVFRDHRGDMKLVYASNLGTTTNNIVEMVSLLRGLLIAQEQGFHALVVEGDSQLLVSALRKI
jgi:ribonuclease HI